MELLFIDWTAETGHCGDKAATKSLNPSRTLMSRSWSARLSLKLKSLYISITTLREYRGMILYCAIHRSYLHVHSWSNVETTPEKSSLGRQSKLLAEASTGYMVKPRPYPENNLANRATQLVILRSQSALLPLELSLNRSAVSGTSMQKNKCFDAEFPLIASLGEFLVALVCPIAKVTLWIGLLLFNVGIRNRRGCCKR